MKCIRKLTPVSLYDVRGLESWLEDMGKRGLHLKRLRPAFSTFERGPAQSLRYRVEPCKRIMDDEVPQAMLDLYQDFGWDFVCDANAELLVFVTQDPDAPEPHSDPELQGQLWKKLYRSRRRGLVWSLLLDLVTAVCAFLTLIEDGTPILNLLTSSVLWMFVLLIFLLADIPQNWADIQRLALIVQQLEEGVPLDHRSVYPRRRLGTVAVSVLAAILLILLVTAQYILPFTGGNVRPLDELTAFPLLSLAEVEGEGYVPDTFVMDGRDYANFCDLEHYLLCWNQWEAVQTGDIAPDGWVRMEINWYNLPAPLSFLSVPLARELLDEAMGLNRDIWWTDEARDRVWTVHYYPWEEGALLAAANNGPGGFQIAAVSRGNKAAIVKYTGTGDLAGHLGEIMAMVQ